MNRVILINYLINKFSFSRYLEIGIDQGLTFRGVTCEKKESVDPAMNLYAHAKPTHKMTSDQFFESIKNTDKKWDVIFIDGLHESHQVDRDIRNSIKHLSENGFIILHDCSPLKYEHQIVPDPRQRTGTPWNGDVWKSVVKFRSNNLDYGCVVLDYDEGLGLINRKIQTDNITLPEPLNFENLEVDRESLLGLIQKENVQTFLESLS